METIRKRMRREKGGWTNLNNTFISNKQRKEFETINKRIEKHNKQMSKINDILSNSQFGDGSDFKEIKFLNYKQIKTDKGVKNVLSAMKKFNRTLDKYGSYQQQHYFENFKKSVISENGLNSRSMSLLKKLNQLEPIEFDMLARVNAEFTSNYNYYDDNATASGLEETLDNYLKSDERKQVQRAIRQFKI